MRFFFLNDSSTKKTITSDMRKTIKVVIYNQLVCIYIQIHWLIHGNNGSLNVFLIQKLPVEKNNTFTQIGSKRRYKKPYSSNIMQVLPACPFELEQAEKNVYTVKMVSWQ